MLEWEREMGTASQELDYIKKGSAPGQQGFNDKSARGVIGPELDMLTNLEGRDWSRA
jgi:hypothetical protein